MGSSGSVGGYTQAVGHHERLDTRVLLRLITLVLYTGKEQGQSGARNREGVRDMGRTRSRERYRELRAWGAGTVAGVRQGGVKGK